MVYDTINYQKYELMDYDNIESVMQKYGGIPGPERFKCYISFDKNEVQNDINTNWNLINNMELGYPYDSFKTARILRTQDGFYLSLEVYDQNHKAIGLQVAKKLELDALRLGCLQKCPNIDTAISYQSRLEYAKTNGKHYEQIIEL